jgi:hypothetical protein
MRRTTLAAAALACAASLAGCGLQLATPTTTTPAPTPTYTSPSPYAWESACDLLVGVDIVGLVGEKLGPPYESKGGRCQLAAAKAGSAASLELYITSPGGADDFAYQKDLQGVDEEISGLGDDAFISGDYLNALVGDNEISLVVEREPSTHLPPTTDEVVAAARVILDNTGWLDPSPSPSPSA